MRILFCFLTLLVTQSAQAGIFNSIATTLNAIRPSFTGESPEAPEVSDLPLIENIPDKLNGDLFVILYTGDGGWSGIDADLAKSFTDRGTPVVGWNSFKYFWKKKTPKQGAEDLARVISYYQSRFKMKSVTIVGFSFGADVTPAIVNELGEKDQASIKSLAILSPGLRADFQFHFADWIDFNPNGATIEPEIEKLPKKMNFKCIIGADDYDTVCANLDRTKFHVISLSGGHHFDGDSEILYSSIVN